MSAREKTNYDFIAYQATLWKTGKANDSLLRSCINNFRESGDTLKWIEARMEQLYSYLYCNNSDSALVYAKRLEAEQLPLDTFQVNLYEVYRIAYLRNGEYAKALSMTDRCLALLGNSKDTLTVFKMNMSRLGILEKLQRDDEFIEGYRKVIKEIGESQNYRHLNYNCIQTLMRFLNHRGRYKESLEYCSDLESFRFSRNNVPYSLLLKGEIFAALHQADSAEYYYNLAAESSSGHIATEASARLFRMIDIENYPEKAYLLKQKENIIKDNLLSNIDTEVSRREFNEIRLQNELYLLQIEQQDKELWMMGLIIASLSAGVVIAIFYQYEKKKRLRSEQALHEEQIKEEADRLQHENQLLHKEAELSALREKESLLRSKEGELREAIFRRIAFFCKLPSLNSESTDGNNQNRKISVTDEEWKEVRSAVDDAFDNFATRLQQNFPLLTEKEVSLCCLIKINVNMKDLSDIYCVSKSAITKRKYRIKTEKLNIDDDTVSLDTFLKSF